MKRNNPRFEAGAVLARTPRLNEREDSSMRLIGAASLIFVGAIAVALSGLVSPTQAQQHDGQAIFRFDTFGDEQLWTDVLRMHEVIATVPPTTALAVGLKIDVDALPDAVKAALLTPGAIDLTNPAVTVEL